MIDNDRGIQMLSNVSHVISRYFKCTSKYMFVLHYLIIGFQMLPVFARLHYHAQTIPDIYIVVWVRAVTSANIVWRCIMLMCLVHLITAMAYYHRHG